MKKEDLYTQWKHHRRQVAVPAGFVHRVMAALEKKAPTERFDLFNGRLAPSRILMRWGAALAFALLGLFRLGFVTANLLIGSTL